MTEKTPNLMVFLLYSDGTIAWTNTGGVPVSADTDSIIGDAVWSRCGPEDQDRMRDVLASVMLDQKTNSFSTVVRDLEGRRVYVSVDRLPVVQPSQHAVVGWCRFLSDEILELSNREREVLSLVCEELTSEQIANQLHISTTTVESHRQNIARKLGTSSTVGQVRLAIRGGLIEA